MDPQIMSNNTRHLYDVTEVQVARHFCGRHGLTKQKGFWDVESDLSGLGNRVWNDNLAMAVSNIGLANPSLLFYLLRCYNHWSEIVRRELSGCNNQSFTKDNARRMLLCGSLYLAQSNKSTLVESSRMASLALTSTFLKNQVERIPEDFLHTSNLVYTSLQWGTNHHLSICRKPIDSDEPEVLVGSGLDVEALLNYFAGFMNQTIHHWQHKEDEAIDSESTLLFFTHLIYAVDVIEMRKLSEVYPYFLQQVYSSMDEYEKQNGVQSSSLSEFNKIRDIVGTIMSAKKLDRMVNHPVFWVWGILYAFVLSETPSDSEDAFVYKNSKIPPRKKSETGTNDIPVVPLNENQYNRLVYLMLLQELYCRNIGDPNHNLIAAVLSVCRASKTDFSLHRNATPGQLMATEEFKAVYQYYFDVQDGPSSESPWNSEWLIRRREYPIITAFVDRHSNRGRNKNTVEQLCDKFPQDCVTDWSLLKKDLERTHGCGIKFSKSYVKQESCSVELANRVMGDSANAQAKTRISGVQHYLDLQFGVELQPHKQHDDALYREQMRALMILVEKELTTAKTKFGTILEQLRMEILLLKQLKEKLNITRQSPQDKMADGKWSETLTSSSKKIAQSLSEINNTTNPISHLPFSKDIPVTSLVQEFLTMPATTNNKNIVNPQDQPMEDVNQEASVSQSHEETQVEEEKPAAKKTKRAAPTKKASASKKAKEDFSSIDVRIIKFFEANSIVANVDMDKLSLIHKPASSAKKILRMDNEYVYKGPYDMTGKKANADVGTLFGVLSRLELLKLFGDETIYEHQLVRTTEEADGTTTKFYIRMPNYAQPLSAETIQVRTSEDEVKGLGKVQIFNPSNAGVVTVKQLYGTPLFKSLLPSLTLSLVFRYLLGVGDSHMDNYIVTSQNRMIQLDVDDQRKTIPVLDVDEDIDWDIVLLTKKSSSTMNDALSSLKPEALEATMKLIEEKLNAIKDQPDSFFETPSIVASKGQLELDEFKNRIATILALVEASTKAEDETLETMSTSE